MFSAKLDTQQETRSWKENDILTSTGSNVCTGGNGEAQPTAIPLDLARKKKEIHKNYNFPLRNLFYRPEYSGVIQNSWSYAT
jgi:hypothetical protein